MLIKRCPRLRELVLDGISPENPVDAHRLTRGRWPSLRKLVLGDIVLDWHSAVNPAAKRPFITFLEEHRALEQLHLLGYQPSVSAPDLLAAVHRGALAGVAAFSGTLDQVQALPRRAALRALEAGMTLDGTLQLARRFREGDPTTPLVLMGYLNPILSHGLEAFATDAAAAGIDHVRRVAETPFNMVLELRP